MVQASLTLLLAAAFPRNLSEIILLVLDSLRQRGAWLFDAI